MRIITILAIALALAGCGGEAGEAQPKKRFDDGVRAVTVEHDGQTFIVFYIDNGYGGGLHAIRKDWE